MKKLPPARELTYKPFAAKLFRDDIDSLIADFGERDYKLTKIKDSEYLFDSLAELEEKRGKVISQVKFEFTHVKEGQIEIEIRRWNLTGSTVYFDYRVPEDLRSLVRRVFEARRRPYTRVFVPRIWAVAWVVSVLGQIVFWKTDSRIAWQYFGYSCPILFPFSLWAQGGGSLLDLRHRHDASFWERNKDAILSNVIVGILCGVAGFAAAKLWDNSSPANNEKAAVAAGPTK
ncbi:MAG TPA: hypothetical protein VK624_15150 [Steroidobacteraceae bacterium]|nr:hypothetical protein [Steroidobacteraceae bacterium]